jgi:hypothetical protein
MGRLRCRHCPGESLTKGARQREIMMAERSVVEVKRRVEKTQPSKSDRHPSFFLPFALTSTEYTIRDLEA